MMPCTFSVGMRGWRSVEMFDEGSLRAGAHLVSYERVIDVTKADLDGCLHVVCRAGIDEGVVLRDCLSSDLGVETLRLGHKSPARFLQSRQDAA